MRESDYYAQGYRSSHATPGYGGRYNRTYAQGYYATEWSEIERDLLLDCIRALPDAAQSECLDFACGTGRIANAVATVCPRVVGVDISRAMIEAARPAGGVELIERDIIAEPLDQRFPLAVAFRFFLNAEPDLRHAAMGALARHLAPGGHLIANVHVNANAPLGLLYRLRNRVTGRVNNRTLSRAQFEQIAAAHGLRLRKVAWYGFMPRPGPIWTVGMRTSMLAIEWVGSRLPFGKSVLAQSFICVFEKASVG